MAIGWQDIQRMKRVEKAANDLGFQLRSGRDSWAMDMDRGVIYVSPKDDSLPHYSREADLFTGSLESIELWLRGIIWAREYDELLKVSNTTKREKAEQVERNRQLLSVIKNGDMSDLKS